VDEPIGADRPSRLAMALRAAFVFLAATGFVAGYLGLRAFIPTLAPAAQESVSTDPVSLVYYTLQLFVLSSQPLQLSGHYNWPLI